VALSALTLWAAAAAIGPGSAGELARAAPAARTAPLAYGFQGDFFQTSTRARATGAIAEAGFGWAKQQVRWSEYELPAAECAREPGNCLEQVIGGRASYLKRDQLGFLDAVVDDLSGAGLGVLLSVVNAPGFLAAPGGHAPADPTELRDFVQFLAARYRGKVKAMEPWNEQNLAWEWGGARLWPNAPDVPPQGVVDFVALQKAAHEGIKAGDPGIVVVLPALTPTGLGECWLDPQLRAQGFCLEQVRTAIDDQLYLDFLYQVNHGEIARYFDVLGVHPSGYNNPPDDFVDLRTVPSVNFKGHGSFYVRRYEQLRQVQLRHGDAKPMWFTEVGWPVTRSAVPGYEFGQDNTEALRGAYIARLLEQVHDGAPYVTAVFLWNLNFRQLVPETDEKYGFGLVDPDGGPTPGYTCAADFVKSGNRISRPECRLPGTAAVATAVPSPTGSPTAAPSHTATETSTATATPTSMPTASPTSTATPPPTATPAPTATQTPLPTATPAPTATQTPLPTATATATAPPPTATLVPTGTAMLLPTVTETPSLTATATPTTSPPTPTATPLPTVTQTPSATPTSAPTAAATLAPTATRPPAVTPAPTASSPPTSTPPHAASSAPTAASRPSATPVPSQTPAPSATLSPAPMLTATAHSLPATETPRPATAAVGTTVLPSHAPPTNTAAPSAAPPLPAAAATTAAPAAMATPSASPPTATSVATVPAAASAAAPTATVPAAASATATAATAATVPVAPSATNPAVPTQEPVGSPTASPSGTIITPVTSTAAPSTTPSAAATAGGTAVGGTSATGPSATPSPAAAVVWATRVPPPAARGSMGVTSGNGTVFAARGLDLDGHRAVLKEYDPAANRWVVHASMPSARYNFALVRALNGRIYAIGGRSRSGAVGTVEEFDPATGRWAARASMPTARERLAVAAGTNGRLYAVGGQNGSGHLATVEEYDPATDVWTAKASMPTARAGLAAAAIGRRVYAVGGEHGGAAALGTVEEYDPAADSWRPRASMPTARRDVAVAAGLAGRLYAAGGSGAAGGRCCSALAVVEEYDPAADVWAGRAPLFVPREALGLAAAANGRLYAIGAAAGSALLEVEEATIRP
jgi:N-acetylneuraminic acid mutarotase